MTNPDGLDIYIYNKKYVPLLIINKNNKLENIVYDQNENTVKSIDIFKNIFNIKHNAYHPAEIITEIIINLYFNNI